MVWTTGLERMDGTRRRRSPSRRFCECEVGRSVEPIQERQSRLAEMKKTRSTFDSLTERHFRTVGLHCTCLVWRGLGYYGMTLGEALFLGSGRSQQSKPDTRENSPDTKSFLLHSFS